MASHSQLTASYLISMSVSWGINYIRSDVEALTRVTRVLEIELQVLKTINGRPDPPW